MATGVLQSLLRVDSQAFVLNYGDETAQQRGGQIRVNSMYPDLWSWKPQCSVLTPQRAKEVAAEFGLNGGSRGTYYFYDPSHPYPKNDPQGTQILVPANVLINSLNGDNKRMSLKGLPSAYVISKGDYLSFNYGLNRALHMVTTSVTATTFATATLATNAATAAGSNILNFAATTGVVVGMTISDTTAPTVIPAGATVTAVTPTTVTMSAAATGAGVGIGNSIVFTRAAGVTPEFFVMPNIRPGASTNAVVTLYKPTAEFIIMPNTFDPSDAILQSSLSFEALQVLR